MQKATKNQRAGNISRQFNSNKVKNTFDLINEIPLYSYNYNVSKDKFEYLELLIKATKYFEPEKYKELEYSKESSIFHFIQDLEKLLIRGHLEKYLRIEWQRSIYINENKKEIAIGEPNVSPEYIYVVAMDVIYNIKPLPLKIAYAHFCNAIADMGFSSFRNNIFDWEVFYRSISWENESWMEEDLDEEDEHPLKLMINDLENNKKYNKPYQEIKKYLSRKLDLETYKPRSEKNKNLKQYFLDFFNAYDTKMYTRLMPCDEASDLGHPEFETSFLVFPITDENSSYEIESIDNDWGNVGAPLMETLVFVDKKKVHHEKQKEDIKRFENFFTATLKIIENA